MKNSILLLLFFLPLIASSQMQNWYKSDLSRLGYKQNTYYFEQIPLGKLYGGYPDIGAYPITTVNGGSFELSVDLYTKHVYFNLDASSLLDMASTLFMFKDKERWFDNVKYGVDFTDLIPIRLAFGTNITPYFGLYLGGQYSYTLLGIRYKEAQEETPGLGLNDVRIGGNTYGFGAHLVGAVSIFNLRYSYMYNWTSLASTFKGHRIDNELVLSFGFPILGFFVKYRHSFNMSNAGYLPTDRGGILKSKYEGASRSWQSAQYAVKSDFSVGIYAAGLFSGVTTGGSKAMTDMERGLMKERQEDRKRKIEWKE